MDKFLEPSYIIDFDHPAVAAKARELADGCSDDTAIAKRCFEFVRDEIRHTGDAGEGITTLRASEVLEQAQGWCYAKSHLLAALLRASGIPTALCYQRLSCSEYVEGIYCLHGLNSIYLSDYGWYRVDARGNKEGVNAQFEPPHERLAFILGEGEYDLQERYAEPLSVVVEALKTCRNYDEMVGNFPDIDYHIRKANREDIDEISQIAKNLQGYIFEENIPSWFTETLEINDFIERFESENYETFIYEFNKKIVGYITIKDENHIYHLFVDEQFQGKKIARKLWDYISQKSNKWTVNSSLFAINVYKSFGFKTVGQIEEFKEMKFQKMAFEKIEIA